MEYSLRREPWWNAVKRARSKRARAASQDAAVVTLRLPAFRFLHFCRVVLSEAKPTRLGREYTAWARRSAPLPTLVIARSIIVDMFRKECSAADGHPRQSGWRSDRAHPEPFWAAV